MSSNPNISFDQIYRLSSAFNKGYLHVQQDETEANRYNRYSGNRFDDCLITTANEYLFSEKIIQLLNQNDVSGWKASPVRVYRKPDELNEDYSLFKVTGGCGPIDNSKSKKITKMNYVGTGFFDFWYGLFFDAKSWDGSDMFSPKGTEICFTTERVKELFVENGITNVDFEKVTETENHMIF